MADVSRTDRSRVPPGQTRNPSHDTASHEDLGSAAGTASWLITPRLGHAFTGDRDFAGFAGPC